jgi:hypothetical protein
MDRICLIILFFVNPTLPSRGVASSTVEALEARSYGIITITYGVENVTTKNLVKLK